MHVQEFWLVVFIVGSGGIGCTMVCGVVLFVDVVLVLPLSDIVGVSSVLVMCVGVFCLLWVCM